MFEQHIGLLIIPIVILFYFSCLQEQQMFETQEK